jgi:tetratricopeptide (TPR) repeat protein
LRYFIFIIWFFIAGITLNAQFNKDSTYAYQDLNKILELARTNNDQKTLAEVYIKLADYEGDVFAEFEKSFEYYRRALEYFKVTRDSNGVFETNHSIAKRYTDAGFYEESINLLQNLVIIYSRNKKISKLANVYFDLNRAYKLKGENELSIEYLKKAEDLNKTLKDTVLLTKILFDKIQTFELNFDLDSALTTAFTVFNINTESENQEMAAKSLFHIGYINKLQNDLPKAIKYLSKSENIIPFQPYSELRKYIYKELADVYARSCNGRQRIWLLDEVHPSE